MALVVKDRVQETSTTTGTGTFTLAGAVSGFQSFSVIGNANTTYYAIVGGAEWEVGLGTYTLSGTTLARTTILESSNGGTAVNFSAGTKNVFVTYPAERALYTDASSNAIALGTPASATLTNATGLPISTGVSGLGTNVATALAVNVGSSGAFVTNGGALGTPSSGTVTNLTGTASININGTVGATTATTGKFTTLESTGVTTVQAGTALLPAITTTGDPNTGIFFPAADTIAFTEGGAEAMRIDSAGNVGIGTTSPNVKLDVIGSIEASPAATQDAVIIAGRAGGTSSYAATLTPTTLTASRTITLPDATGTIALYAAPQITTYLSGSGTYTVPTGAKWLYVKMVGGGGGGGGGNNGGVGGAGGNTTFGTSLLTANGGGAGQVASSGNVGTGGSGTIAAGATGLALTGGQGSAGSFQGTGVSAAYIVSSAGGNSAFGGGGGGTENQAGGAGATNTGGGGAGGGASVSVGAVGGGGGAGGHIEAYITSSLSSTYSYAVGAGGTAGTAGTSAYAGGAGGSGLIIVTAYFG